MSTTSSPSAPEPAAFIDDKSPHCIPFILSLLSSPNNTTSSTTAPSPSPSLASKPFIIALNGIQGSGKTTLVSSLATILRSPPHNLPTLVLSIDDLYLPHASQAALAASHPDNPLVQHRGVPGTHDLALARALFAALRTGSECRVPAYDKAAYDGQGDRVPEAQWQVINREGEEEEEKVRVVIFEGWCVGFSALPEAEVVRRREGPNRTLSTNRLEDLLFVNERLAEYDQVLNCDFDAFIHLDAEDTDYVYKWRQEQEAALWREKGTGMSVEQVTRFVDGYYPAYELYTERLRGGIFRGKEGAQGKNLRLIIGSDRRVKEVMRI
ncbi:hypothetical protein LZ554_001894 [Drepanopeziza brunnea f. sp. 'monogermtubi']|nr:hypothetical protein LZ554_001894 [Drepanopeziza brunnea f. sp. 'monogermtubi']